jgi:cysteine synthase B
MTIGNTSLKNFKRIIPDEYRNKNIRLFVKMESENLSGSVKDRAVIGMIEGAERRGEIANGDTLLEPTSGNTGISLSMICQQKGYKCLLVISKFVNENIKNLLISNGAELEIVDGDQADVRDRAKELVSLGRGKMLDQFSNDDNWRYHYSTTGPEIWKDTGGKITHFVSCMGTMGTITGVSKFLKEMNPDIEIIGVRPDIESWVIPGISRWRPGYEPQVGREAIIDRMIDVSIKDSKITAKKLYKVEGIKTGFTSGANIWASLALPAKDDSVIVTIVCDREDRYTNLGIFDQ